MPSSLIELLNSARRHSFVGRERELRIFNTILNTDQPFQLLHIYGPGGVGKSSLLQQCLHSCLRNDADGILIDAADVEPTPDGLISALEAAMETRPSDADNAGQSRNGYRGLLETLRERVARRRQVILIDTYEKLLPLDDWLRERFLPHLPLNTVMVVAGREPPLASWRRDPGWRQLMQVLELRNLTPDESRTLLEARSIPSLQHDQVLAFTHGHPLALSIVADVFDQRPDIHFQPDLDPDVIGTLLEQLLDEVPGPAHRAALEVSSLVRSTTESLLGEILQLPAAHELFAWLRRLSFMSAGRHGLYPHDLVRQALQSDLRWRNPDWYAELHERARRFYKERLQRASGDEQQLTVFDYIFLHRDNPMVAPFFEWQASAALLPGPYRPADRPDLLSMVRTHEGPESAHLLLYWLGRQPHNALVFRDIDDEPVGLMMLLALNEVERADRALDPAVDAALRYLERHAPLRADERATHFRFWLDREAYQAVSPLQSLIFVNAVRHYLTTPGLAFTFLPCADPDFWQMIFAYAELDRLPDADFKVGERAYGVYGHDWRAMPPLTWLDVLGAKEVGVASAPTPPRPVRPVIVLSEPDFAAAVRDLLRNFHRPDLHENPLLWSRLVQERAGVEADAATRIEALRALVEETARLLSATPREARFHRVLHHTFFDPGGTQEQVSEQLDLALGTYRRYLRSGIERLTELLWLREAGQHRR